MFHEMQNIMILLLTVASSVSSLKINDTDYEGVLVSLFENAFIKRCLILEEFVSSNGSTRLYVKRFSRMGVATAILGFRDFYKIARSFVGTYWNTAVVLHLENDSQIELLCEYTDLIPDISLTWMVLVGPGLKAFTNRIDVPIFCQFLIIELVDDSRFKVNEFYKLKHLRTESLWGTWSNETKLSIKIKESLFRRRRDFSRATLVAMKYPDSVMQLQYWYYMMDFYNFTSMIVGPFDRWPDGERIEAFIRNLAFHYSSFSKDVVAPLETSRIFLFMRRPPEEPSFWDSYIRPFTADSWMVALLFFLLVCILIPVLKITVLKTGVQSTKERFDPVGYGCLTFDTFIGQSGKEVPAMTLSFRIVFFVTVCAAALLQCLYSGDLISYLITYQKPPPPFSNLTGFIEDGTYNVTFLRGSFTARILLNDFGPVVADYVVTHYTELKGYDQLPDQLCNEGVVWVGDATRADDPNYKWPCDIVKIPQPLQELHSALLLRPISPFTSAFKTIYPWLLETGHVPRDLGYYVESFSQLKALNDRRTADLIEIDMPRMAPAIILIALGITLSVLIMLLEYLLFHRRRCCMVVQRGRNTKLRKPTVYKKLVSVLRSLGFKRET